LTDALRWDSLVKIGTALSYPLAASVMATVLPLVRRALCVSYAHSGGGGGGGGGGGDDDGGLGELASWYACG
jgi:hypothetical protein